jgi:hypothetical protein
MKIKNKDGLSRPQVEKTTYLANLFSSHYVFMCRSAYVEHRLKVFDSFVKRNVTHNECKLAMYFWGFVLMYSFPILLGFIVISILVRLFLETLNLARLVLLALKVMLVYPSQNHVKKAPGTTLLSIVEFLFAPKTVEGTFNPIVADWRNEFFEALKQGRTRKARWISIRYTYSFILAMSLSKVFAFFKSVISVGK